MRRSRAERRSSGTPSLATPTRSAPWHYERRVGESPKVRVFAAMTAPLLAAESPAAGAANLPAVQRPRWRSASGSRPAEVS